MVPMLARIALAREQGLLDNRRLVVPEGLSPWMLHSLDLLGLDAGRRLTVAPGAGQVFDDALLVSAVEHVSPAAIAALRRGLMGLAAPPAAGPMLFLSRRGHGLRLLVNQDEVEAIAADLGFQVVAPQELGIAGQVALFASARGVAAVEGAALANTIFCPPGIGVLAIVCENEMMPIFNDLSILLGHHHRKLAGAARPVPGQGNRLQPPFHVAPDLARAALQWVLQTAPKERAR
jgi:capsular polysaccharide biosynthesis protein